MPRTSGSPFPRSRQRPRSTSFSLADSSRGARRFWSRRRRGDPGSDGSHSVHSRARKLRLPPARPRPAAGLETSGRERSAPLTTARARIVAFLLGVLFGLAGPLMVVAEAVAEAAAPSAPTTTPAVRAKVHGIALSGRVTRVDVAAKTFTVRDGSGRVVSLAWTAATQITGGELKAGETITLRYLDKDKKHIATTIHVGPLQPARPTPASTPTK